MRCSERLLLLSGLHATEYRFESAPLPTAPVATHCPDCGKGCDPGSNQTNGCWAFNQIIPGALLRDAVGSHTAGGLRNGSFVLYVAGSDWDGTDGGGRQRVGVATGASLSALTLRPEYLIEGTPGTRDERSLFPNGALLLECARDVTFMSCLCYGGWSQLWPCVLCSQERHSCDDIHGPGAE